MILVLCPFCCASLSEQPKKNLGVRKVRVNRKHNNNSNPNTTTTMSTTAQQSVPFLDNSYSLTLWILIGLVICVAGFQLVRRDPSVSRQNPSSSSDPVPVTQSSPKESSSGDRNPDQTSKSAGTAKAPDDENNNKWRCACEGGFLPPGLLKTFGGAEAVMRLGSGQCYHKQM